MAEHKLDATAAPIATLVLLDGFPSRPAIWDARVLKSVPYPVDVIAAAPSSCYAFGMSLCRAAAPMYLLIYPVVIEKLKGARSDREQEG